MSGRGTVRGLGIRPRPVFERSAVAFRHQWWVLLSGVAEPIFYLLGMGLGLGGLVGEDRKSVV